MNLPTITQSPVIWTGLGMSKETYFRCLFAMRLTQGNSKGAGNAASRRLRRIQDQAEAEAATAAWFDANRLSEADVDNLAAEWQYRHARE